MHTHTHTYPSKACGHPCVSPKSCFHTRNRGSELTPGIGSHNDVEVATIQEVLYPPPHPTPPHPSSAARNGSNRLTALAPRRAQLALASQCGQRWLWWVHQAGGTGEWAAQEPAQLHSHHAQTFIHGRESPAQDVAAAAELHPEPAVCGQERLGHLVTAKPTWGVEKTQSGRLGHQAGTCSLGKAVALPSQPRLWNMLAVEHTGWKQAPSRFQWSPGPRH